MSQFYVNSAGAAPPPDVPTTIHTPDGDAVPENNIINFLAADTTTNFDNGITITGSGDDVTYFLTNRGTGTVSTANATPTTIITLPLGAAGTYYIVGNSQAFASSIPGSAAFTFSGGIRTDGVTAVVIGTEYHDTFQDGSMSSIDIDLTSSGNNAILNVIGLVATNVSWNSLLEYRQVN